MWRVVCRGLGAGVQGGCTKVVLGKRVGAMALAMEWCGQVIVQCPLPLPLSLYQGVLAP